MPRGVGYGLLMSKKTPKQERTPLPSTLQRSPKKAQDTYEATLESAERTYDNDESRAHRAAWGAVKHAFEKVGDHWEAKAKTGPSDSRSREKGPDPGGQSFGGVNVEGKTKAELFAQARQLGAPVTSSMMKAEIARRIERANDKQTAVARRHK